jgi:multidrug efflux pump subunit AcrB
MWLIRAALRRPITVIVAVIAMALTAVFAVSRMRADIFPDLDLPVIYVAQPYGGMSPAQMEGYITYYYEYHFLYVNGIESVESKSIQNTSLLKLTFHPGTDMAQALAQTIGYVNRAHAFMPPGTVGPFIMRFDAGTVPVGYLVFSSRTRSLGEIQDLALNRVRPQFATLPGLTSPPPFGGSQRTIVVRVDPDRLRAYGMAPDEVIRAVTTGNVIMPSGSVNVGDVTRISPVNSVVSSVDDLLEMPIRTGAGPAVLMRDIGSVSDSTDIPTAYALVNGRRAVYIPVTKRPDASTLTVVSEVKANLGRFQSLVPDDITVSYELDQSRNVSGALQAVLREAALGALLTGLMVLLFLRDWRSSAIVVVTIPFALLTAVVALWGAGHTINIMTLGGLALAVGILVDEATVAIENIHTHLARGVTVARGVLEASGEVVTPRLLAMFSVVAVFVPSFFMTGVSRSLFVPLSLAVGFSMIASFLLSSSLVPVLSVWMLRGHHGGVGKDWVERLRDRLGRTLRALMPLRVPLVIAYMAATGAIVALLGPTLGREVFPSGGAHQFQLRFRAPAGTKFESTERLAGDVLDEITRAAGPENVDITLGYVGVQPSSYPINTIFLWTGGSHEGVLQVALKRDARITLASFEETLRGRFHTRFPTTEFSFEPGDIVSRIMNFSAPTPVEIAVAGPDFAASRAFATKVRGELARIATLRDLQYEQTLEYPAIQVNVDRQLAGQLGVTVDQVGRSFAAATSSSRFVAPNYWADPRTGIAFQVQVEVPQPRMTGLDDLRVVPVAANRAMHPLLGDVARIENGTIVGEYDRINGQRMVTLSANLAGEDLGRVADRVDQAIARAGAPPRGATVSVRGQIAAMRETFTNISAGLVVAVAVIFLLLAANFQSLRLALVVVSTVPAVLTGVVLMLMATRTTLNVQSFMGAIMAIGVAVANAILLVTFAEQTRRRGGSALGTALDAAIDAARTRMRPVLMTSAAMIAGMVPMALAIGEGAEATAPLGRAVIGGLAAATFATLLVLPSVYSLVQQSAGVVSVSLDPDDPESAHKTQGTV